MRKKAKPVNVHVEMDHKIRNFSKLLKVFRRAVKESGVLQEVKERRRNYKTKGQKRRQKISRGKVRQARKNKRKKV